MAICNDPENYCNDPENYSHTLSVLYDVLDERKRQDEKWGRIRDHPDGTHHILKPYANTARMHCKSEFAAGRGTWRNLLEEEFHGACAEDDQQRLRAELIQVAAVAVAWIEAIDRRKDG